MLSLFVLLVGVTWESRTARAVRRGNDVNSDKNQPNIVGYKEQYGAETLLDLLPSYNPSCLTRLHAQIER